MTIRRPRGHLASPKHLQDLRVFYQPIVALPARTVVGVEALARLRVPSGGLLLPEEFLPQAEADGSIVALDEAVFRTATQQLAAWIKQGLVPDEFTLSVNVSAASLQHAALPKQVAATIRGHRLEPKRLLFELTERARIADVAGATQTIEDLRGIGVRLALDDFGSGYSLHSLQQISVDVVKLDRVLVEGIDLDGRATMITQAAITLADALGATVIAEWVETTGEEAKLIELGCQFAQGFLYSAPLPALQAEALLKALTARGGRSSLHEAPEHGLKAPG